MHPSVVKGLKGPLLGAGVHSEVFAIDDDWVVKRMHDERDGFWTVLYLSEGVRERLHLPRIDLSRSDMDEGIIVIERLQRLDWDLWEGTDHIHTVMNDLHLRNESFKFNIDEWLENTHPLYDISSMAYRAWKFVKRAGFATSLDINPSNIMMRKGDKKLILSDPFGYLDI